MRLDWNCVRDILLCVEENTDLTQTCHFVNLVNAGDIEDFLGIEPQPLAEYQEDLHKLYTYDTLLYHVQYCINAGLVCEATGSTAENKVICDLSVKGHDLLGNIRDEKHWTILQKALSAIGNGSLSVLTAVAEGFAAGTVTALLHSE